MLVFKEGNVYLDRIPKKSNQWHDSVFVCISLRLGLNHIQAEYLESIKEVMKMNETVGIAGGKENAALYFVGLSTDRDELIYLDPHYV